MSAETTPHHQLDDRREMIRCIVVMIDLSVVQCTPQVKRTFFNCFVTFDWFVCFAVISISIYFVQKHNEIKECKTNVNRTRLQMCTDSGPH